MNKKILISVLIAMIIIVLATYFYLIPHMFQKTLQFSQNPSWCKAGQTVYYKDIVKKSELTDFSVVMKVSYAGENFCWVKSVEGNEEYYVNQNNTRALRLERNESAKSFKLVALN